MHSCGVGRLPQDLDYSMSQRRELTAILSADVVGYPRLKGDDERATVETLRTERELIGQRVEQYEGRIVSTPGDALLAAFPSAAEAMDCAQEIQRDLSKRNARRFERRRMQLRIGINSGDVIEENGTLYGDGISIVARLEKLAYAGGICVSGAIFDQAQGKLPLQFQFIGQQHVKNILKPVRVYRLIVERLQADSAPTGVTRHLRRPLILLITVIIVLAAIVGSSWYATGTRPIGHSSAGDAGWALDRGSPIGKRT